MSSVTTLVPLNNSALMDSSAAQVHTVVSPTTHNIDTSDPVTKAVVDNIVGNLPTKKPQV